MKRADKYTIAIVAFILLTVAAVIAFIGLQNRQHKGPVNDGTAKETSTAVTLPSTIKDSGKTLELNHDITTVLFLGIDDAGKTTRDQVADSGGRSDTMMLLLMDKSTKTTKIVGISRDTMVDVAAYDVKGDYAYTALTHINMQYAYGDSAMRSCYLTKKVVSSLMMGMRINGCISLTMDGIPKIVDDMGGLTIVMPDDYTYINPEYEQGKKVTLTGEQTEKFLRYRNTGETGSNEDRMNRQLRLIDAIFGELKNHYNADNVQELTDIAGDTFYTDLDAQVLENLATYTVESKKYTLPGTLKEGEAHDEFYVDTTALEELIKDLFYKPE